MREESSIAPLKMCAIIIKVHVINPMLKSSKGTMSMVRGFMPP
jgi:hypothetical protein